MSIVAYLRSHLAAAEGGSRLFERCARGQSHPDTRAALRSMHEEIVREREWLRRTLHDLGGSENRLLGAAAVVGERVGRLAPHGHLLHRTDMTDLTELEALRTAVSGKLAGYDALLAVVDRHAALDRDRLSGLRDTAREQLKQLESLHAEAASRALAR